MSSTTPLEPRAKRTHARRSCELCKVRKTRCELPDVEVVSSQDPLSVEKSCHRCRVLSLPCVVDDSLRKTRAKRAGSPSSGPSRAKSRGNGNGNGRGSGSNTQDGIATPVGEGVDHNLDVLHGFQPHISPGPENLNAISSNSNQRRDPAINNIMPPFGSGEPTESYQMKSMKLHGRPLELVCAMLGVAYGKNELRGRGNVLEWDELDLNTLVGVEMRRKLEFGYAVLRTYHSYLDPLRVLFESYNEKPTHSISLLLSTCVYLSTLVLPSHPDVTVLRQTLTPYITSLRNTTLLQLPSDFHSLQALDMLSLHAPLGCLPFQPVNPRTLLPARGHISASSTLVTRLAFIHLFRRFANKRTPIEFEVSEIYLFFSLCVNEASLALENETPTKPAHLAEARDIADILTSGENIDLWKRGCEMGDPAEMVGRLGVCDRIMRVAEVHDAVTRLRGALETVAGDANFDVLGANLEELKFFTQRMEDLDKRHDSLMLSMSPNTRGIEASWLAYRNIRRRFELNKVYGTGLRFLIATAYLPGTPLAFSGLPPIALPGLKVSYAISRATNPPDILPFIIQTNNPATQATWTWGIHRGGVCSGILQAFIEGSEGGLLGVGGKSGKMIPIVECAGMVLEASKILMEIQAGSIMMGRVDPKLRREFPVPDWLFAMKRVSGVLRGVGNADNKGDVTPGNSLATLGLAGDLGGDSGSGAGGGSGRQKGENVLNGISNLLGSMVRMADEWYRLNDQDDTSIHGGPHTGLHGNIHEPLFPPPPPSDLDPSLEGVYEAEQTHHLSNHTHSHQGYMDTSDRWMASDQGVQQDQYAHGHGHQDQGHEQGQGQVQHPTPVDFLLSQMFNYNSIPGGAAGGAGVMGGSQGFGQVGYAHGQSQQTEGINSGGGAEWSGGVGHAQL